MKSKNLYEYFGCRSVDELLELVVNRDERVRELIEFLETIREFLEMETPILDESSKVCDFLEEKNLLFDPKENAAIVISLNTQLRPLSYTVINNDMSIRDMILEISNGRAISCFVVKPRKNKLTNSFQQKLNMLEEYFSIVGTKIQDTFTLDGNRTNLSIESDNSLLKHRQYSSASFADLTSINTEFEIVDDVGEKIKHDFSKYPDFKEFIDRYAINALIGKNVLFDEERVKETLKVWKQFGGQEEFGVLLLDKNYTITSVQMLFKGSVNASVADPKFVVDLLKDDDVKAFAVFHNHPSGNLKPSNEDLYITEKFIKVGVLINKPIFEHYIASTSGVACISQTLDTFKQMKQNLLTQQQSRKVIQEKLDISLESKIFETKSSRYQNSTNRDYSLHQESRQTHSVTQLRDKQKQLKAPPSQKQDNLHNL